MECPIGVIKCFHRKNRCNCIFSLNLQVNLKLSDWRFLILNNESKIKIWLADLTFKILIKNTIFIVIPPSPFRNKFLKIKYTIYSLGSSNLKRCHCLIWKKLGYPLHPFFYLTLCCTSWHALPVFLHILVFKKIP